ncbi:MAG TPA: hypothetical protein VFB12_29275 [Ktedonobacteraceae bacterium]|nr:hypothetical protein [Ktedonobacteraceae bacterium]
MLTTTSSQPSTKTRQKFHLFALIQKSFAINPLLTLVGMAHVLVLIAALIGIVIDHRIITGVPAWVKPAKFAISITIYTFTLLWFLSFIKGHRRLVGMVAYVVAIVMIIEMTIIVTQVIRGTTSHFNVSTPLDSTLYSIMGSSIVLLFVINLIVAVLLLLQRLPDPIIAWSLRLGILLMIVGMGVAFLMTTHPTAEQMAAIHAGMRVTAIGGHTVGLADGGPGLPFLGWSTVGGDLRIPHFVGLHALQVLPLLGWLLTRRRFNMLGTGHRVALIWTFGASYLGLIGLLTWQALRAQSIIAPDASTLQAFAALLSVTALAIILIATHARMNTRQA